MIESKQKERKEREKNQGKQKELRERERRIEGKQKKLQQTVQRQNARPLLSSQEFRKFVHEQGPQQGEELSGIAHFCALESRTLNPRPEKHQKIVDDFEVQLGKSLSGACPPALARRQAESAYRLTACPCMSRIYSCLKMRCSRTCMPSLCRQQEFETLAQRVITYIYFEQGIQPGEELFGDMYAFTRQNVQNFTPQDISNLVWSCATLCLEPPQDLWPILCSRVGQMSREFNLQEVSNLLWGFAVFSRIGEGVDVLLALRDQLVSECVGEEEWTDTHRRQIHQFLLCLELESTESSLSDAVQCSLQEIKGHIAATCRQSFSSIAAAPSQMQCNVAQTVSMLGVEIDEEAIDERSGYSIDIVIRSGEMPVAIEVDGPSHFLHAARCVTGATSLKRRHLKLLGYKMLCVPYWEWGCLTGVDDKEQYVRRLLEVPPTQAATQ